jgi:hypothetical protein
MRRAANLPGMLRAAFLLITMANGTFSYGINTGNPNPPIDYVRLLVADTQEFGDDGVTPIYIFSDQEILATEQIVMGQFQSAMFFSPSGGPIAGGAQGAYLPSPPIPYYRVAGVLMMAIASNKARLSSVIQLLDVKLDTAKAAKALFYQAQEYFDMDDNSGAFVVIEQVNNDWSFRDRWWKQWQRQSAS